MQQVTVYVSTGADYATDPGGNPIAGYAPPVAIMAQVQGMTTSDIRHADMMNLSGVHRTIYLNGEVDGLVRSKNKGGDLIVLPDGSTWLVADVPEHWPDWTKCIVTLQDDQVLPATTLGGAPASLSGPPIGAGLVHFGEAASQATLLIDVDQRTQLVMTLDPAQTLSNLRGAFAGVTMWDGQTLTTPDVNDVLQIRIGVSVTPIEAGGFLRCEAQIVGFPTVIAEDEKPLSSEAGVGNKVSFNMTLYSGATFKANGVQFYLTPTNTPCSILNETITIAPISSGS